MKSFFRTSLLAALALATTAAASAAAECTKIVATGHPQYPVIAFQEGDALDGAAPELVEAIAKKLDVPIETKFMGSWSDAQQAAFDGKADLIFAIYYNDERAKYLDYVQPAFTYDDVAIFVAKGKAFPFSSQDDLIGKKGITNKGESYGAPFDAFMTDKLDVARTDGIDDAFEELLAGKADYLIAGYFPGVAEAAKIGIEDKVEVLDQAVVTAEMFVAFSKKSPCAMLAGKFGQAIAELTTDGSFDRMLADADAAWDADQAPKN